MSSPLVTQFGQVASRVWYWPVLRGIVAVALGMIALVWPGVTAVVLVWCLGIFLLVDGIMELVSSGRYVVARGWHILSGILGILVGLMMIIWPGKSTAALVVLLAIWALVGGVFEVVASIGLRKIPGSGWGWGVVAGILLFAFGVLALVNISGGLVAIVWVIALWAIVNGLLLIAFGFSVRSFSKQVERAAQPVAQGSDSAER